MVKETQALTERDTEEQPESSLGLALQVEPDQGKGQLGRGRMSWVVDEEMEMSWSSPGEPDSKYVCETETERSDRARPAPR